MDRRDEASAIGEVQQRLAVRYPQLGAEVVEAAVRVAHSQLNGPIREFVPVLVEHIARERLASMLPTPISREASVRSAV